MPAPARRKIPGLSRRNNRLRRKTKFLAIYLFIFDSVYRMFLQNTDETALDADFFSTFH